MRATHNCELGALCLPEVKRAKIRSHKSVQSQHEVAQGAVFVTFDKGENTADFSCPW